MDATTAKAAEKAFGKFKNGLLLWASVAAVVLALLAIFAPLGAANIDKYVAAREHRELQLEQKVEAEIEQRYEARIKALSDQVEELKRAEANKPTRGSATGGKP
jgi:hypothetical protein